MSTIDSYGKFCFLIGTENVTFFISKAAKPTSCLGQG